MIKKNLLLLSLWCVSQGVDSMSRYEQALRQVRYKNSRPAALTDRKFRITCSELNGRYTSNEFILEVSVKAPPPQSSPRCPPRTLSLCPLPLQVSVLHHSASPEHANHMAAQPQYMRPVHHPFMIHTLNSHVSGEPHSTGSSSTFKFNRGQAASSLANVFCFSAVPSQQTVLAAAQVWGNTGFLAAARSHIKVTTNNQTDVDGPFIRFYFPLVSSDIRPVESPHSSSSSIMSSRDGAACGHCRHRSLHRRPRGHRGDWRVPDSRDASGGVARRRGRRQRPSGRVGEVRTHHHRQPHGGSCLVDEALSHVSATKDER